MTETAKWEREKFERTQQHSAQCFKMADVRSQRKSLASEVKRVAKRVAEAEARLNMECDRSLEYGEVGAQKSLGSENSAAPSYCSPS